MVYNVRRGCSMKLLYMWIKNNNMNVDVNFTSEHIFSYDENKNILNYKLGEKYRFFDDDLKLDVHAIVGDNGVGKSTIMKRIISEIADIHMSIGNVIYAYLDSKNKINIFYNYYLENSEKSAYIRLNKKYKEKFNMKFNSSDESIEKNYIISEIRNNFSLENNRKEFIKTILPDIYNTHFIYYSNIFDNSYSNVGGLMNFTNLSTNVMIYPEIDYEYKYENQYIEEFFYREFLMQVEFVCNYKKKISDEFKLPKTIMLELRNLEKPLIDLKEKYKNESGYYRIIFYCLKINEKIKKKQQESYSREDHQNIFYCQILISFLYNIIKSNKLNDTIIDEFNNIIFETGIGDDNEWIKQIENFFNVIKSINQNTLVNDYYDFFERIKKIFYSNKDLLWIGIGAISINISSKGINLKELYESYMRTILDENYINFSWSLSSGEYNFLSQLARFYSVAKNGQIENKLSKLYENKLSLEKEIKDVIILIDEGDNTFHPKWQQLYLDELLKFLRDFYSGLNLQLIIATHSPIILSDIPNDKITYLRRNTFKRNVGKKIQAFDEVSEYYSDRKTFGANIYNLYNSSFFLGDSNYGIIGRYAEKRIKEVENILIELAEKIRIANDKIDEEFNVDDEERDKIVSFYKYINSEENCYSCSETITKKLDKCKSIIDIIGEEVIAKALQMKYEYIYNYVNYKYSVGKIKNEKEDDIVKNLIQGYIQLNEHDKNKFLSNIITIENL